jgi:4a-hydroxytetrahydrobiopterin dehydratase
MVGFHRVKQLLQEARSSNQEFSMPSREKLSDDQIESFVTTHSGWSRRNNMLTRSFKFSDYSSALAFVVRVSLVAEKRDHHPDIFLGWGRAEVSWTTHDSGGITALDTSLAEITDKLYAAERT